MSTRLTLFVPGPWSSRADFVRAAEDHGVHLAGDTLRFDGVDLAAECEWIPADGTFARAFASGRLAPARLAKIERAPGALVSYWPVDLLAGRKPIVEAVERLRNAGALAVRIEQSKVGHGIARWLELVGGGEPGGLHRAAVALLREGDTLQSCGMHAFSLPDARVSSADPEVAAELILTLNGYQIAEDPLLLSGQTFSPSADAPRHVVERWPDDAYPPDSPCHNPFGVWRLSEPGARGRPCAELRPVFIPTLSALLTAAEKAAGRPLTEPEVEATRDKAACMTMKQRDAQRLERQRGYADLEPELAWAQWQALVRGRRA